MFLCPYTIQNIVDGNLSLRDLILEHCIGNIFLMVKMSFSDIKLDMARTDLMVLKYDKNLNVMFWEDSLGGHHDVTKVAEKETTSHIKEKLDSASLLYVFQLELNASTGSQK